MLSHAVLASLAAKSYRGPQSGRAALDCEYDLLPQGADELVVVMPGTHPADPLDWLRDLSAAPHWLAGVGPVHGGFGRGGEALYAKIAPTIAGDPRLISFVGHSLGGALAQALGAIFAARQPGRRCRVVTLGAPRVGFLNPWLGRLLRQGVQLAEYARAGDIVPELPMAPPFNHPSRPRRIGEAVDGTPKALADFFAIAKIGRAIPANHSVQRYEADLAALAL
jgi:hypothetical protein